MKRFRGLAVCIVVLAGVLSASAAETEFPVQGLEQRVDFWKKVFTQYGENDIIIHDTYHVNLIYDVASDSDVTAKKTAVRDALRELRGSLGATADRSPLAQQIAESIMAEGLSLTGGTLSELIEDIHTQRGVKELFRGGVIRSGRWVEEFREILKDSGVPEDLALLPLVESSFQNARSSAGAVGVWQFTRGTGKLYLKISGKTDERLDPVKSAQAAAKLLRGNYDALGVWPLAVTAYNHGRAGMQRAKAQLGTELPAIIEDYKSPLFGYASMNFYTEFLAAVDVYKNYPKYFGELALDTPNHPVAKPAQALVASAQPTAPAKPQAKAAQTKAQLAAAAAEKYKVRRGDTLSEVASRFGTSIRSLMERNNLEKSVIYAGQILLVR